MSNQAATTCTISSLYWWLLSDDVCNFIYLIIANLSSIYMCRNAVNLSATPISNQRTIPVLIFLLVFPTTCSLRHQFVDTWTLSSIASWLLRWITVLHRTPSRRWKLELTTDYSLSSNQYNSFEYISRPLGARLPWLRAIRPQYSFGHQSFFLPNISWYCIHL